MLGAGGGGAAADGACASCCAAAPVEDGDDAATDDADLTAGGGIHIRGAEAGRLFQAFEVLDTVQHSMGGREMVDVANVDCQTKKGRPVCTLDRPGFEPSRLSISDDIAGELLEAMCQAVPIEGPPTAMSLSRLVCKKGPEGAARCTARL